jgi:hypothetical protein
MPILNNSSYVASWRILHNSFDDYMFHIDTILLLDDFLITLKHII